MESNRAVLHRVVKERPHRESDILAETRNMRRSLPCKELDWAFQGDGGASRENHIVGTRLLNLRNMKLYMTM